MAVHVADVEQQHPAAATAGAGTWPQEIAEQSVSPQSALRKAVERRIGDLYLPPVPPTSDLARWRADTPGCAERIHLNNAGAALQPRPVLEAVRAHLQRESEVGGYEAADEAAETIQQTYDAVARLVGCATRNIAVVENATVAFAQALTAFDFRPGDVVVTSRADYVSNQLMYLSLARRLGVEVRRAADLPEGGVDPESVRAQLAGGRVRLVAVTWIPTRDWCRRRAPSVRCAPRPVCPISSTHARRWASCRSRCMTWTVTIWRPRRASS
jgi:hypothetical protein